MIKYDNNYDIMTGCVFTTRPLRLMRGQREAKGECGGWSEKERVCVSMMTEVRGWGDEVGC